MIPFKKLKKEVVDQGLCSHCGTCIALSGGTLAAKRSTEGVVPDGPDETMVEDSVYKACPGKGLDYPALNNHAFGRLPEQWLIGNYVNTYIGYSSDEAIRRAGASAGVITHLLIYLLESGEVDGVIASRLSREIPYQPETIIAKTREEIISCAQSIYQPVAVNQVLEETQHFKGKLAYTGLPDQVASIRYLQMTNHPTVKNISIITGPYVGINMQLGAIRSFLKSNGFKSLDDITKLDYRAGEWPGYLQIETKSGKTLKAEKFYYNYLLPFFVTNHSLLSVDFSNELTDISVGDAWHPKYEKEGKGFSVVVARNEKGREVLRQMQNQSLLHLEEIPVEEALNMHGHMFDFKKRGSFIRGKWRKLSGKKSPDYGYVPEKITFSRYLVEMVISGIFLVCRTKPARFVVQLIPIKILGVVFNGTRKSWKQLSKPTKRKGLLNASFRIQHHGR
jgi:coenzyme F420 hydrogenase subunit beta